MNRLLTLKGLGFSTQKQQSPHCQSNTKPLRLLSTVLVCSVLTACGSGDERNEVDSETIDTRNFQAYVTVTATNENFSSVDARLVWEEEETFMIDLINDDAFSVNVENETKELRQSPDTSDPVYSSTFNHGGSGDVFNISLRRTTPPALDEIWFPVEWIEDDVEFPEYQLAAPNSSIELPNSFSLAANPTELSDSDDSLSLTWDPDTNGDEMALAYTTRCPAEADQVGWVGQGDLDIISDPGTATLSLTELLAGRPDYVRTESCAVTVKVQRRTYGVVDPNLSSASLFTGIQERSVTVIYQPNTI